MASKGPVQHKEIRNLVFDLGGVIINLDVEALYGAFIDLSGMTKSQLREQTAFLPLFIAYETGQITSEDFRHAIRRELNLKVTDTVFDDAWNRILLDIPRQRVELLQLLAHKYRLFLLSNTNQLHIKKVNEILQRTSGHRQLEELFTHTYYSYDLGLRKPDVAIYEAVIRHQNLVPSETVFIDDLEENLAGAEKAGLKTLHVTPEKTINHLFEHE